MKILEICKQINNHYTIFIDMLLLKQSSLESINTITTNQNDTQYLYFV